MDEKDIRDNTGKFVKGVSGNPGGRSKQTQWLVEKCKELTPLVMEQMEECLRSGKARWMDKIKAGELITAYGYGKPTQNINLNDTTEQNRFTQYSTEELEIMKAELLEETSTNS